MARRALIWGSFVLLALAAGACGGSGPDETPPRVLSTQPADGETGVDARIVLRVVFDEDVDNQRANFDDLLHLEDGAGQTLWGNGSYDMAKRTASCSLIIDLQPGATYFGVLERGVCDLAGNCTSAATRWSFTTAQ